MKTALKILVTIHTSLVFLVCINGLSHELKLGDKSINKYGAVFLKAIDVDIYDNQLFETLKIYGIYTGTARGYSFFSPNVSRIEKDFYFIGEDDQLVKPKTRYFETGFKYNAFKSGLFKEIFSQSDKNDYLKSLGAHFMSNNSIDCIDMYMSYTKYNELETARIDQPISNTEDIHLFTLRKRK